MKAPGYIALLAIFSFCFAGFSSAAFAQQAAATCSFQSLNVPGALTSTAAGINDHGAVVGSFTTSAKSEDTAFLLLASCQIEGSR